MACGHEKLLLHQVQIGWLGHHNHQSGVAQPVEALEVFGSLGSLQDMLGGMCESLLPTGLRLCRQDPGPSFLPLPPRANLYFVCDQPNLGHLGCLYMCLFMF